MGRYRKIDPRIWNDEKFRTLTDDAKLVFLFILTHPHLTSLGAMRANEAGLAHELGWPFERFRKGFEEPFRKGLFSYDEKASFLALTNFLKYNGPDNPNVVKSWQKSLDLIPECDLKIKLIITVRAYVETLPEGFIEGLPEPFRKGLANQEQEQEQYLEQEQNSSSGSGSSSGTRGQFTATENREKTAHNHHPPVNFVLTEKLLVWAKKIMPEIDTEAETEKFLDFYARDGTEFASWPAAWRKWMRDAVERSKAIQRQESAEEHNERLRRKSQSS